ncbi:MAG: hypothetical protein H6738_02580 [Alphaproteobacteria bacterium]|nr:hypothetical protein [Alphaproteobacteria bacterium]MCB9695655.1 hypothetical protein [Alphaproteobacteria bacterium]
MSLVVSSFWIDSVTGEFHEHVSWDDGRYQAGLEAYRVSLWGSEAVRRRGARFLPRLARENLRVEHDELDAFVAELDTLDADADALCGELGRDDTDRIRRYLDHFRAAAELGRARGGGVIID